MKRGFICLFLLFPLLLASCQSSSSHGPDADEIFSAVKKNRDLFTRCAAEMEALGEDRIYVAMEPVETKEGEPETGGERRARLVSYGKESDSRTEITNPVLQEALERFGLALIFFQTSSDSRRTVIFSFAKENQIGTVNGFYYSFDSQPSAWWGRRGDLVKSGSGFLQTNQREDAWYVTLLIEDHFYYFEKTGNLVA